jgi:8-oxo-dGTP pyrophosphatase MutT (NUDIX family)
MAATLRRDIQTQSAALPWREAADGGVEFLLVTTRRSGQWSIPKGKIAPGYALNDSAAKEAWEEAGVVGACSPEAVGIYRGTKRVSNEEKQLVEVVVYPLKVERQAKKWPEKGERRVGWFTLNEAVLALGRNSPVAAMILDRFGPRQAPAAASDLGEDIGDAPADGAVPMCRP